LTDFLVWKGKKLKLPAYFPTIFPAEPSYTTEIKTKILIPHITNTVLISSYNILKEPQLLTDSMVRKILDDSFIFMDSGGFLIKNFEKSHNDIKVMFHDGMSVSWRDIFELQNKFAEIGNSIDFFSKNIDIKSITEINSQFIELYLSNSKKFLFFPTIRAENINILKELCEKLKRVEDKIDGISVGGLVNLKNDWRKIITRLFYVRSNFPRMFIHVFGIGNPTLLPVLFSIGISSVDSTSYLKYALDLKYIHPTSLKILELRYLKEKLPCNCKICSLYSKSDLMLMRDVGKALLAIHNLYVYNQLVNNFHDEGSNFLEKVLKVNPEIAKKTKFLKNIKEFPIMK
jgi:tRNA-guanine family transglycosylase